MYVAYLRFTFICLNVTTWSMMFVQQLNWLYIAKFCILKYGRHVSVAIVGPLTFECLLRLLVSYCHDCPFPTPTTPHFNAFTGSSISCWHGLCDQCFYSKCVWGHLADVHRGRSADVTVAPISEGRRVYVIVSLCNYFCFRLFLAAYQVLTIIGERLTLT